MLGIVTALENEYVAVDAMLENASDYIAPGAGSGRRYRQGQMPALNNQWHQVVLALADTGDIAVAVRVNLMLQHFPQLQHIILVGVGSGVPDPGNPVEHVRLGDVVVSDRYGIVRYDPIDDRGQVSPRYVPRPPSAWLLEAVRLFLADEVRRGRTWIRWISQGASVLPRYVRPAEHTDQLYDSCNAIQLISHPPDRERVPGQPRVFLGTIASADRELRDPILRDQLRDQFHVKAIEQDGTGLADVTWVREAGYLVVRGVCDYGDSHKTDMWRSYAALAAAAYTRGLLASLPTLEDAYNVKRILIVLDRDFHQFDAAAQQNLICALAALLGIDQAQVRILQVTPGSLRVTIELPAAAADRLLSPTQDDATRFSALSISAVHLEQSERDVVLGHYPTIPFVNRQAEIDMIRSDFGRVSYRLIDAPAGYGKSVLLTEIADQLPREQWNILRISLEPDDATNEVLKKLLMALPYPVHTGALISPFNRLISRLRQLYQAPGDSKHLLILFDCNASPSPSLLTYLLSDLIPNLENSLRLLAVFGPNQCKFRVMLVGRYFIHRKEVTGARIQFSPMKLSPFSEKAVQLSVQRYLVGFTEQSVSEIAAHLLYLTGGHPGGMAHALHLFRESGATPADFLTQFRDEIWRVVWYFADDIHRELAARSSELRRQAEALCVLRIVDNDLLQHMQIHGDSFRDVYDLSDQLTQSHFYEREYRLLRDDITRRLLAVRLRRENPAYFAELCQHARQLVAQHISQSDTAYSEQWVLEYMLLSLLPNPETAIDDAEQRTGIREMFWTFTVPEVVRLYIERHPFSVSDRTAELRELLSAIEREDQWEFRFIINYYLRDESYTDSPCRQLQQRIAELVNAKE